MRLTICRSPEAPWVTSLATGNRIDQQVRDLACWALDRAIAILSPRRQLMDELVERLIDEETIEGDRFRQAVEDWQAAHPDLAGKGLQEGPSPRPAAAPVALAAG
jgi:cell division protease FtsH